MVWRIWIPTWRFFNTAPPLPRLYLRSNGEWLLLNQAPRRHWWQLFFSPSWTNYHVLNNLLIRLMEESQSASRVEDLVSFKLVNQVAREQDFRILVGDTIVFEKRSPSS